MPNGYAVNEMIEKREGTVIGSGAVIRSLVEVEEKMLANLAEAITHVEDKLDIVLRPEDDRKESQEHNPNDPSYGSLASRLNSNNSMLEFQIQRLHLLIDRVQL